MSKKLKAADFHQLVNGRQALIEIEKTPYYELALRYAKEGTNPHIVYLNHVNDWDGREEGARRLSLAVRYLQETGGDVD